MLWRDFEINVGRFLLSLWRNFRARFSVGDQLTLQEVIAREIQSRSTHPYGYTAQEVADGLRLMVSAKPSMSDYQQEECSFTQYNEDGFALVYDLQASRDCEHKNTAP